MTPNLTTWIGFRYSRSKRGNSFSSLISIVSFMGLVLGVAALTVVVSVMNGFDRELKERILGAVPHVTVQGLSRDELANWAVGEPVAAIAPFVEAKGLLVSTTGSHLLAIYGVVPELESTMSTLPAAMSYGQISDLRAGAKQLVVGEPIARKLALFIGDQVTLIIPRISNSGRTLKPALMTLELTGMFEMGSELDYALGVMHLDDLASIADKPIIQRLRLTDVFLAPLVSDRLLAFEGVVVKNWTQVYGDFFRTVRMEKILMFILLSFVLAVAAFSIVSGLSMLVDAKRRDIAVLQTMGLSRAGVMRIFVVQGMTIAALGILVGVLVGLPLAYYTPDIMFLVEQLFAFSIVEGTYFDQLPTDVRSADVLMIILVAFAISFSATIVPAYRASRLNPAEILRYE